MTPAPTTPPAPPSDYLVQPPGPDEQLLAQQVDLRVDQPVPFGLFARSVLRQHATSVWVHGMDTLARRARRHLIAAIGFALVNLSAVGGYFIHRVQSAAIAEERALVQDRAVREWRDGMDRTVREWRSDMLREIDGLRIDVRELRRELRRMSGVAPSEGARGQRGGADDEPDDRLSAVLPMLPLMADPTTDAIRQR